MAALTRTSARRTVAATLKDVAARAGVSVGTVSNVLNHPERVAETTLARVRDAIADLAFIPSAPARQLRARRTHVLGLVVPDIANPFFTDVARGVEDAALDAGYSVILCNTDGQPAREDRYLAVLESQRISGLLITPARRTMRPLGRLMAQGVAVALLDSAATAKDTCSVCVDNAAGGALACGHVRDLGHRHIAWLAGPADIPQVAERERGLRREAQRAGLSIVRIAADSMSAASGEQAMRRALTRSFAPTAVICANDLLALGAMRVLRDAGLAVPRDMSVVGYDDIDFAASAAVPLTSVRQPRYELGRSAADLVIDDCVDPRGHAHQRVRFEPQLVVRESTGPAPR